MTTFKTTVNWDELETDCQMVHQCSAFQMRVAVSRKDRKEQKRLEKQQESIRRVRAATETALKADPNATEEQLTGSILATLLPWVLPFLRDWLIGAFEKLIINWFTNKLKTS